ncbi:demethylmenaquinone methyltransferase [Miniimonas sp. S16]|uniref:demethylmenaquinone methyltransferase n=1 Tax=Miniimonas sp. S16 TaxID=2171623 RepID=UPI000D52793C|nr:demethylmenaquinone methyltransferase [Miniimonas sp. S16]
MARAQLDKKPEDVAGMFDDVARRYDVTNDVLSLGMDRFWRRATVRAIDAAPGERVLDLAAGTGTSSAALADGGVSTVACDFSQGMVFEGKRRRPDLAFVAGDATRLPFADDTFDAVTISFGLRNVNPAAEGLAEMRRVTRPGGRLVVCEFSTPPLAAFGALYRFYLRRVLTPISRAVSSNPEAYDYLEESILDWPDQHGVADLLHDAGWRSVSYRNLTGGIVALHRAVKS